VINIAVIIVILVQLAAKAIERIQRPLNMNAETLAKAIQPHLKHLHDPLLLQRLRVPADFIYTSFTNAVKNLNGGVNLLRDVIFLTGRTEPETKALMLSKLSTRSGAAELQARFGTDYAYVMQVASVWRSTRKGRDATPSHWISDLAHCAAVLNPHHVQATTDQLLVGDPDPITTDEVQSLDVVARPLFSRDDIEAAARQHDIAGLAEVSSVVAFDASASSPGVVMAGNSCILVSDSSASSVAVSNLLIYSTKPPPGVADLRRPEVKVTFSLQQGFDTKGLQLGLAIVPLAWHNPEVLERCWAFSPHDKSVLLEGRKRTLTEHWKVQGIAEVDLARRGLSSSMEIFKSAGMLRIDADTFDSDDITFSIDTDRHTCRIYVNDRDIGVLFNDLSLGHRPCDEDAAFVHGIRPVIISPKGYSATSKVSIVAEAGRGVVIVQSRKIDRLVAGQSMSVWSPDTVAHAVDGTEKNANLIIKHQTKYTGLLEEGLGITDFGALSAIVVKATELFSAGLVVASVTELLRLFASNPADNVRLPTLLVAKAYLLIGDACLSDSNGDGRRAQWNAEIWYARALLCLWHPGACDGAMPGLALALHRALTFGKDDSKRWNDKRQQQSEWSLRAPLFTMVVIDRLLGVLKAQGRAHHGLELLPLFRSLWLCWPCPVGFERFVARHGSWHGMSCDIQNPFDAVFGHSVPHIFGYLNEFYNQAGRLGFDPK
jgi:hypothetical protein